MIHNCNGRCTTADSETNFTSSLAKAIKWEICIWEHRFSSFDFPTAFLSELVTSTTNGRSNSVSFTSTHPRHRTLFSPFQPNADENVNAVESKEDIPSWRPRNDGPFGNSTGDDVNQVHSWPLQLEDLIDPDPPFASEDRHYFCTTPTDSRPSESRLSTITEEGTIRESVATPPNIIVTDTSSAIRKRRFSLSWKDRYTAQPDDG